MNMLRHKRTHIKLLQSRDEPPEPTPIDVEIAQHQGASVAIDATQERLQATKNLPTPSLSKIIEQRTWENGRLRQELAYQQRKNGASIYLLEEVKNIIYSLQQALLSFQKLSRELGDEDQESVPEPTT
ncbi:hypothetical protein IWW34DRAFT_634132 [Fusarium oxysporum f. sp. albedinis]|nr:hypothetical protein IWW34DRAFT_634132 [Fusarium oxysporum f. sp. albedinis]